MYCGSYIGGVICSDLFTQSFHGLFFSITLGTLGFLALVFRKYPGVALLALCLGFFVLGIIRYQQVGGPLLKMTSQRLSSREVTFRGYVTSPPERMGSGWKVIVRPMKNSISFKAGKSRAAILLNVSADLGISQGQCVKVRGAVTPLGQTAFSPEKQLIIKGIRYQAKYPQVEKLTLASCPQWVRFLRAISLLRGKILSAIEKSFPEPHASLFAGIVLGVRRSFTSSFYHKMRDSGVLHVIVASGFNVSFLLSKASAITSFWKKPLQLIVLTMMILLYNLLSGFQPPLVRATIMGGYAYLALVVGRPRLGLIGLLLAAALMLLWNPLLYQSYSFQLSFIATLALILVYPVLKGTFGFLPVLIAEPLETTLSVQLAIVPWLIYNFSSVSLASPIFNVLVVPLVEFVMAFGLIWVIWAIVAPWFPARVTAWLLWVPLEAFVRLMDFDQVSGGLAVEDLSVSKTVVILYYFLLVLYLVVVKKGFSDGSTAYRQKTSEGSDLKC